MKKERNDLGKCKAFYRPKEMPWSLGHACMEEGDILSCTELKRNPMYHHA